MTNNQHDIAAIIRETLEDNPATGRNALELVAQRLAHLYEGQSSSFKVDKFLHACGLPRKE